MGSGGGGGGILGVSNSFTGASSALEIQGDHAYAYSGLIANPGNDSTVTAFSFNSGNYYFVGNLNSFGWIDTANQAQGKVMIATTSLNAADLILLRTDGASENFPSTATIEILIPPYSLVEVKLYAFEADASTFGGAVLTGRIYR